MTIPDRVEFCFIENKRKNPLRHLSIGITKLIYLIILLKNIFKTDNGTDSF
jgi:hypothetical protein